MPWPLEKFVARSPVMLMPAVTAAAACSPSGSKKRRRRPFTFVLPPATASAHPSPICVDGVIGYAPAASLADVSMATTAPEPSIASGLPGYFATGAGRAPSSLLRLGMSVSYQRERLARAGELRSVDPRYGTGRAALDGFFGLEVDQVVIDHGQPAAHLH